MSAFVDIGCFDENYLDEFVSRCRAEGVTVNSAIAMALNLALFKTFRDNGVDQEDIQVSSFHVVNMRRFMDDKDACGFNVQAAKVSYNVTDQDLDKFWEGARGMHKAIRNEFLGEEFIMKMVTVQPVLFDARKFIGFMRAQPVSTCEYMLSNTMDVREQFSGVYPNISVDWMTRSTNMCLYGIPLLFNVTTFRGKLLMSANVMLDLTTTEMASAIGGHVIAVLKAALCS